MNRALTVLFFILLSSITFAADDQKSSDKIDQGATTEVPGDTFDGNEVDSPADIGKPMRMPSADGLPYTDDEIQNNLPEGYKPKNMPIDKD